MDLKRIKRLITIMEKENLAELEFEDEDFEVKIIKPVEDVIPLKVIPQIGVIQSKSATSKSGGITSRGITSKELSVKKIPIKGFENKFKTLLLTSPMVGFFYHSPTPTSPPYVQVGDKIIPSQIVGAIEVMGVINEIEAKVSGEIKKILVEDGHPVEYGQSLFLIEL